MESSHLGTATAQSLLIADDARIGCGQTRLTAGTTDTMIRLIATAMMALTAAVFFFVFVYQDIRNLPQETMGAVPWGLILRYALAMTAGGALAGALFCGLFGRSGILGWLLSFVGGILATSLAGLLGSTIAELPTLLATGWSSAALVPIFSGLLVLPFAVAEQPVLALVLIGLVGLTHVLIGKQRRS